MQTVNLHKYLASEKKEFVLSKQLLRSGSAVGALVREAEVGKKIAVHEFCSWLAMLTINSIRKI